MTRTKKPDAPKFAPVTIADYRPAVRSLATPEAERAKLFSEDHDRILVEKTCAFLQRREVLREYLENEIGIKLEGDSMLLKAVADKYVPGFAVEAGNPTKPGAKKIGDRFKTVTEIDRRKFEQGLSSTSAAIEAIAAERRPAIRPPELSTKYYACLREIEASGPANALLNFWRRVMQSMPAADLQDDFDFLFWECERDYLGATLPHNVTPLKARKS